MSARKDLLSGSSLEVSVRLDELCQGISRDEYVTGNRLRLLAVELARRPELKVSVVTYDESQELEVSFTEDPHCEPMIIDRDGAGENCQITWDRWLSIRSDHDVKTAAEMVAGVLSACGRFAARPT